MKTGPWALVGMCGRCRMGHCFCSRPGLHVGIRGKPETLTPALLSRGGHHARRHI